MSDDEKRTRCKELIDKLAPRGLDEAVESFEQMVEYWGTNEKPWVPTPPTLPQNFAVAPMRGAE
jgi:hypothetical protein